MTTEMDHAALMSRDEVERRAASVLQEYGLDAIPVDPLVLANRFGISVRKAEFLDNSLVGAIARRGKTVTIVVNANDPPFRKRFTIAHELGHNFLHLLEDGDYVDGQTNLYRGISEESKDPTAEHKREIQANIFATALLMPEHAVRQLWPNLRTVGAMARCFDVSEDAMGVRLNQLGLI